jgi:O-methyltransferase
MKEGRVLGSDELYLKGVFQTVKMSLRLFGFWKSVALFVLLKDAETKFLRNAQDKDERLFRREMLKSFKRITSDISCAHSPFQFPMIYQRIKDLNVEGPIVECGAFKGGSTAQLSIMAKRTKRRLYVCDSFEGLPEASIEGEDISGVLNTGDSFAFKKGDYTGSLEEVKRAVARYGHLEVCEFVKGFFNQSLPGLHIKPAVIILDVDLISSARDCLKYLWPSLKKGGLLFTHEASLKNYIEGFTDREWWKNELNEAPPVLYGAGSGIDILARQTAFMVKE